MKIVKTITLVALLSVATSLSAQDITGLANYWQIGIGLGELPMGGSFKPSLTIGYHFNEKIYAGFIYQFKDYISRNSASINANSAGIDGLIGSSEEVAQRFLFQVRYTPIKNGPYLSTGFVFNGKDTEEIRFDERSRVIAGELYEGSVIINQSRPAGWGFALGLGYQYNFKNGFSAGFEWTPAWFQYPMPTYEFTGTANLTKVAKDTLTEKMNNKFDASVTNMYKVFHVGVGYRFKN